MVTPLTLMKRKKERWSFNKSLGLFALDGHQHINCQCISLGASINWNYRPSIEVSFLFWTFHLEYQGVAKKRNPDKLRPLKRRG